MLIKMQSSIAGLVALATDIMQSRQERHELVEILQARDIAFAHVLTLFSSHAGILHTKKPMRNAANGLVLLERKCCAERDWNGICLPAAC